MTLGQNVRHDTCQLMWATTASSTTRWARCGCRPAALWQAQTQRAVENFPISGVPIEPALIAALGLIKGAAAQVNAELGVLEPGRRRRRSPRPPARSRRASHDAEFPIDVFQTGSGTSTNMNTNEVIATLAGASAGPSRCTPTTTSTPRSRSNDVFPTVDPRRRDRGRGQRPDAGAATTSPQRWRRKAERVRRRS